MQLIYGTNNPAKLESMRRKIEGLDIELIGLNSLGVELIEPKEIGKDPLENAILKARGYYQQVQKPLFSCDSGLYFEEVAEEDQPGIRIKRIHGMNLSYMEMVDYYSKLSKKYGGRLTAYYRNSICLIIDENTIYQYDGEDIWSERFYIVDKPHGTYYEGFPLDSLSVEIESNRYYYDLEEEKIIVKDEGFKRFFRRSIYNHSD